MDRIRVSEALDTGSIPVGRAMFLRVLSFWRGMYSPSSLASEAIGEGYRLMANGLSVK